ncbi:LPXTG cell wall anchor domain-containing protein [Salicibibacter halophilus]|uniref:LPXTG cell wall anchor domain-containing protein n=1 Tax=Salicibibacter halophilus TaxID=2502791 RepID=UPI00135BF475|nr:LPXTG cell wall anchor domain-containing protein [Salicibibacter halophilus]
MPKRLVTATLAGMFTLGIMGVHSASANELDFLNDEFDQHTVGESEVFPEGGLYKGNVVEDEVMPGGSWFKGDRTYSEMMEEMDEQLENEDFEGLAGQSLDFILGQTWLEVDEGETINTNNIEWAQADEVSAENAASFGEGTFKVGTDIQPGTYEAVEYTQEELGFGIFFGLNGVSGDYVADEIDINLNAGISEEYADMDLPGLYTLENAEITISEDQPYVFSTGVTWELADVASEDDDESTEEDGTTEDQVTTENEETTEDEGTTADEGNEEQDAGVEAESSEKEGGALPDTATNTPLLLAVGLSMSIVAGGALLIRRRLQVE